MTPNPAAEATRAPGTQQFLSFEIGGEMYAVDILRVREIRGWTAVARIPHAPRHMLGILNLRGSIVPIVDLRLRFDLQRVEYNKITVIIVLSVSSPTGRRDVGVVVDAVSDVVAINTADVKQAPALGAGSGAEYIRGLISVGNRMVILLETDSLVGTEFRTAQADTQPTETAQAA